MPSESSATTTTASVLAPRLMANEPAIGQRSTRTERARGLMRSTLGLLPPPTKPRPAGVWSLKNLPEAGKPAAGWGRGGEGVVRRDVGGASCEESHDPHRQPLPTRGRGAHRACGANVLQAQTNML